MTEQELNIERQRKNIIEKEKEMRNKPVNNINAFQNKQYSSVNTTQKINTPNAVPISSNTENKQSIKAPMNVQDILNRLHNSENNNTSETQEETSSNNDRIVGTSSMNSSERRKGRKKKSIIHSLK